VLANEHSLNLWKRHPCTSTVWRQLTDWCEQVTTWRDMRGLLKSHSDIVCLSIQSNCIELQPPINILIWVAWFFSHPVGMPEHVVRGMDRAVADVMFDTQHSVILPVVQMLFWCLTGIPSQEGQDIFFHNWRAYPLWTTSFNHHSTHSSCLTNLLINTKESYAIWYSTIMILFIISPDCRRWISHEFV
jgi:hypothetical protein